MDIPIFELQFIIRIRSLRFQHVSAGYRRPETELKSGRTKGPWSETFVQQTQIELLNTN